VGGVKISELLDDEDETESDPTEPPDDSAWYFLFSVRFVGV